MTEYAQTDCLLPKSFFEGRNIPDIPEGSHDYDAWWDEQIKRCLYGYSDGGYSVTGVHYYHLNFKKIVMLDKNNNVFFNYPYFSFEDQEMFNELELCRKEGKAYMVITARGFGKTYNVCSLVEHEFTFKDVSESIISASIEPYPTKMMEKIIAGLDSQPEELRRTRIKADSTVIRSGYEDFDPKTKRMKLYDSESYIRKIVFDNNPEKVRSLRPSVFIMEEIGAWNGAAGLIECYKKSMASGYRGSVQTCLFVLIGTGGAMDSGGSIDARVMAESPEEFNIMPFKSGEKTTCKFFPAYKKLTGFYEKTGKTDEEASKNFLIKRRDDKKKNASLYFQELCEFPFNIEEAFLVKGGGTFPNELLEKQYLRIHKDPKMKNMVQRGNLNYVRKNSQIVDVEWEPDENGIFEIIEHPVWRAKDWKYGYVSNLYIAGCDSYDAFAEDTSNLYGKKKKAADKRSRGSTYVYKRFFSSTQTYDLYVAKICMRTDDAELFYESTYKLALYYNLKVLVEYTKIGIIQWFLSNNRETFLYPRPSLTGVIKETVSVNKYGLAMPYYVKQHIISLMANYVKKNVDQIYFPSLLHDMMRFDFDSMVKGLSHDETMAAAICLVADDDLSKRKISAHNAGNKVILPVYRRDNYGQLVFD